MSETYTIGPTPEEVAIRIAACTAHRACCGTEHDPSNGKLHGYCVVCGVPWPCDTAQIYLAKALPPAMTWTSDKPTKPGWYWWVNRNEAGDIIFIRVVQVTTSRGSLFVIGWDRIERCYGEWAGPMEPPQ